jgi:bifunctional DNA-binding transcriptional regulator/antitoxin component of YhaV-PrlF toxin-antitoxin module
MTSITMDERGNILLPPDVLSRLGLEGDTEMEVEVDLDDDAIILRPAVLLRREDAWAYTPEHRELLRRAHDDVAAGRVRRVSKEELEALADE